MAMDVELARDGSQGGREEKGAKRKEVDHKKGCGDEGALQCLLMARAKR
jgi:hypothetical protein